MDDLAGFIGAALNAGNAAVVVATEAHRALDAAAMISSLTVNNQLDPARFLKVAGDLIMTTSGILKRENPRVAICGECEPPLWTFGKKDVAIEFEKLWNEVVKRYEVDVLCGYSLGTVVFVKSDIPSTATVVVRSGTAF